MLRVLNPKQLEGYVFKNVCSIPFELLAGNVAAVLKDGQDYILTLEGTEYRGGRIIKQRAHIRFSDRGPDREMLATRITAAHIKRGSFMSVFCMQKNAERIALDFRFYGLWRFHGYQGEINVLLGKTFGLYRNGQQLSTKFVEYGGGKTFERIVSFREKQIADAAKRYIEGNNPFTICKCGPERNRNCYDCFAFEVL